MDEPDLNRDETVIFRTPDVFVKSIPFEAILTDQRVIIFDRVKNLIPPKEIPLDAIRDVESGENAIRDPTLTLSVQTSGGEKRQMVLTFSRHGGGGRTRERNEWAQMIKKLTGSPVRNVLSAFSRDSKKIVVDSEESGEETGAVPKAGRKAGRAPLPIERTEKPEEEPEEPAVSESLQYGSFCTRCGNRLPQGSLFCNRCGTKVPAALQGSQAPAEPRYEERPQVVRVPQVSVSDVETPVSRQPAKAAPKPSARKETAAGAGSFFSRIFPKKAPRKGRVAEKPAPARRPPREGMSPAAKKKVLTAVAAVAVVILVLAGGYFAYTAFLKDIFSGLGGTPDGNTTVTPAGTGHPTVVSTVTITRTPTQVVIPTDGVYVRVSYIGGWKGSYGVAGNLLTSTRSGDAFLVVENATGTVQAAFMKNDASTKPWELFVEIYKDGSLVKRGSTTEPKGKVDVSVNIDTATAITAAATATVNATAT